MRTLTEKQFEKAWSFYWSEMNRLELSGYFNEEALKEKMKVSSCALSEDTGVAYPGGLLSHINVTLTVAKKLLEDISEAPFNILTVDERSLIKVILLQHISKIEMYEPNDNTWEIERRGLNYKFSELEGRLKFGERSILIIMNKGITLTAEEFEAIRCLDRENENSGTKAFDSNLSMIVRQANEIAYAFERMRNK